MLIKFTFLSIQWLVSTLVLRVIKPLCGAFDLMVTWATNSINKQYNINFYEGVPIQDLEKLLSVERGRVERLEGRLLVSTLV